MWLPPGAEPDAKLGIEDVVPRWARKQLNIPGPIVATARDRPGDERRQVGRRMALLRVVLKDALCQDCNSGWLGGKVEKPAARLLGPMAVRGQPKILNAADQRLAAFWGAKTVLLLEMALRQMQPGEREIESL